MAEQEVESSAAQLIVGVAPAATCSALGENVMRGASVDAAVIATTVLAEIAPDACAHVSTKLVSLVKGPTDCPPNGVFAPVHPPDASQLDAVGADQISTTELPERTTEGRAINDTVEALDELAATVTGTPAVDVPPDPVQVRAKVEIPAMAGMVSLPFVDLVPDQAPDAKHVVASVTNQIRALGPPALTLAGVALNVMAGLFAVTLTVAVPATVPPAPVHVSTKFVAEVSGPVDSLPLSDLVPDQPPDAAQFVALDADHVIDEAVPTAIDCGVALIVNDGDGGGGGGGGGGLSLPLPPHADNESANSTGQCRSVTCLDALFRKKLT